MSLPKVQLTHAAVKVKNVKDSGKWFQEILGLKPAWSGQDDWGMLKSEGSTLALIEQEEEVHPPHLGFVVPRKEDVDLFYEKIKNSEATDVEEPRDHRDKSRSFYFKDPNGNQFELLWIPENLTR